MGFTLMKDALSRALVTRLAPGGAAFRLGVRTGTFVLSVILVHIIELLGDQKSSNAMHTTLPKQRQSTAARTTRWICANTV